MLKVLSAEDLLCWMDGCGSRLQLDDPDENALIRHVSDVLRAVAARGDSALREYTRRFDGIELIGSLEVGRDTCEETLESTPPPLRAAMEGTWAALLEFHQEERPLGFRRVLARGQMAGQIWLPLERVGMYVPGGRYPYFSSVLMNAAPARVAGVEEIIMVTPPARDGWPHPLILAAAALAGVHRVFRVGGAQAVFALALGTENIPRVDQVVGPGNKYVVAAKRLVQGMVGTDSPAGPSEVAILAHPEAPPHWVACDLLAQLEHDPDSQAFLVTWSPELISRVEGLLRELTEEDGMRPQAAGENEASAIAVPVRGPEQAIEVVNALAPEHLELMVPDAEDWLAHVRHAGTVFLGPLSTVALGDYNGGTNHVLPTRGAARFASPLGVADFMKRVNYLGVERDSFDRLAPEAAEMAAAEGLVFHRRSLEVRADAG